ncbi:MAG: DUF86 domain-containing protein [Clostridia bacterium]|nr:DUF86 domain-containing protein [Clostridia bacterium]
MMYIGNGRIYKKRYSKKYPEVEWIVIKNLRNKIVHDYEGIKLYFIWDIITEDIPMLKENLQYILKQEL